MTLYFAYGSNLNLAQFFTRCPTAQLVGPAHAHGWRLRFAGHGHADIVTADEDHNVPGVLYLCDTICMRALDRYEGVSYRKDRAGYYKRQIITVAGVDGKDIEAVAYVMTPGREDCPPSDQYVATILEGCHSWMLDLAPAVVEEASERGWIDEDGEINLDPDEDDEDDEDEDTEGL